MHEESKPRWPADVPMETILESRAPALSVPSIDDTTREGLAACVRQMQARGYTSSQLGEALYNMGRLDSAEKLAAAEAKAAQYERDWYDAKSEFGDAMARARAQIRESGDRVRDLEARLEALPHRCGNCASWSNEGALASDGRVRGTCRLHGLVGDGTDFCSRWRAK